MVEHEIDDARLQRMIERIEGEFTRLGETEPYWSVLMGEEFKRANFAPHEAEFFAGGKGIVDELRDALRRSGIEPSSNGVCFELGCGVGRSTPWLADVFATVVAADISAAHLAIAEATARRAGKTNIEFRHLNSLRAFEDLPPFDVFFSFIVLQHNPPPLIGYILRNVFRVLRPNGVAYFQLPTYAPMYRFAVEEYLAAPAPIAEMHILPQSVLFRLIHEEGCDLLEIREDGNAGLDYLSNRILARKR
jgi:SAM-dependent methyltransferase